MKNYILHIVIFCCLIQQFHSQDGAVVAFDIPVRNSMRFNRYAINPTFSFVKEDDRYISFTNKRQWTTFDDAPQTYLFSYSGKFRENMGLGIGLFQQDYGVLTTFGGMVNYAYSIPMGRMSDLTFGLNAGFYTSGLNEGRVVTNFPDPSLNDLPSNSLIMVSPGINYGTEFFDFGVSVNNAALFNITTSELIEDNPEQSIQAHGMYTGFLRTRGFLDESKFSALLTSEFKPDATVIAGLLMVASPKGIWAQAGYNTLYGLSAGLGINVTSQIAMEYNFEKGFGNFVDFGSSHEITLAYRFKRNRRLRSNTPEEESIFTSSGGSRKPKTSRKKATQVDTKAKEATKPKIEADVQAKKANEEAAAIAAAEAAEQKRQEQEALKLKQAEAEKAKLEAEAKAAEEARVKAQEEAARVRAEEQQKAREAAQAKEQEDARLRAEQERIAREAAENKAREEAEAKALAEAAALKLAQEQAEQKAREEAEALALKEAQEKAQEIANNPVVKSMDELTQESIETEIKQEELLSKLQDKVAIKQQDLNDLKKENDLSEQGIYTEPKPFKSLTAEKNEINALKDELDKSIEEQRIAMQNLEEVLITANKRKSGVSEETIKTYNVQLEDLKNSQLEALKTKVQLERTLAGIEVALEIERKRRIKRAAFDDDIDRYKKDRAQLDRIKKVTPLVDTPYEADDFDYGDMQDKIQILNNVSNVESGYYSVLAIHSDEAKRDEFVKKVVASGDQNVDFFFDVKTSKYYIYSKKHNSINAANDALETKGNEPYNGKMSIIKIEN